MIGQHGSWSPAELHVPLLRFGAFAGTALREPQGPPSRASGTPSRASGTPVAQARSSSGRAPKTISSHVGMA
jgi:hypothetical protein